MAIIFEKIRYKNFLSSGNIFSEIDLNKNQTTLIVGDNGAGKSTFLDAITFGLFGKPFRNINKPQLVNSINEKDCLVEVEFSLADKNYLVRRGIKPNIFEIFCGGRLLNQDAKSKDYQDYLENSVLKMSYKSFTQIVILGSTNFTPFMQLSAHDRREVIEDLLDIQIFSSMNSVVKSKFSAIKEEASQLKILIDSTKGKIELHKKHLEELKKNTEELIGAKKTEIEENELILNSLEAESQELNIKITELTNQITDEQTVLNKSQKIQLLQAKIESNAGKVKKDIEFYSKNATCPTCDQTINNKEEKITSCNHKMTELTDGLDKLKVESDNLIRRITDIRAKQSDISDLQNSVLANSTRMYQINLYIRKLTQELNLLEKKPAISEDSKTQSNELLTELTTFSDARKQCLSDLLHYEVILAMLKDGGIKSKIIKQYVPIINKQVNKYLASMDFFVNFTIDEEFNESIKSRHRDSFSYENFSEGEKARLNLAILFAWRSIAKLKNSVSTNLLILDEVFDGSLDTFGTESLLNILSGLGAGTNLFVISHKTEQMVDKFNHTIKFSKVKNFSTIIN